MSCEEQFRMIYAKTGINTGRTPPTDQQINDKINEWVLSKRDIATETLIEDSPGKDEFKVVIDE